ncbi:sensor histidine kinase [Tessaracoccus terricola]
MSDEATGTEVEAGSGMMPMLSQPFHRYSLQMRVFLSQMPLMVTLTVTLIFLALTADDPFGTPLFQAGLVVVGLLTVASGVVPWDRTPYGTYLIVPMLDFVAVALLAHGQPEVPAVAGLLVFPVLWLAWSSIRPRLMMVVSFVVPLLVIMGPRLLFASEPFANHVLSRSLALATICLGVSVATTYMQREMEHHQEQLSKEKELGSSRRRLVEAIINTADVGVLAIDSEGREILKNRRQHRLQARAEPLEPSDDPGEGRLLVFGGASRELLPVQDRPVRRAARAESFTRERHWLGVGAEQRAVNISASPMRDEQGEFAGSVLVFEDVTELVAALAAQDEFVAGISHEFRTPLTSIIGYTDILLERPEDAFTAEDRRSLIIVQRNAERLLGLVNDLLGTAAGVVSVVHERVDLSAIAKECAEAAHPLATLNGLTLRFESDGPAWVVGDRGRLAQAFDNLVSNAVKYTVTGGAVVRAGVRDGRSFMEVEDTGPGLTPKEQRQIFDRFYRTEGARASTVTGSGLGMAVVKAIVDSHRGELEVDSEIGRGTRMTILMQGADDERHPPDTAGQAD